MDRKFKRTLVTCALPYANGPVHIGHLAGVYVPADVYVRYLRMKGEDVLYICGSDEHGVPITIKAKNRGVSPQDVVDEYHKIIKESFSGLGINFDIYSRTTSEVHAKTASAFFRKLYDEGKFVTKETEQYYDEEAKTFLADRYITGTCPKCGNPNAYGDQCEKCGSTLSPEELIDPKSALSGSAPVKRKTKHWYLPLDQYEPWLRDWILERHKEWKTNVYGQCKSWLDGGLQPRAVSRDLDWGIPVPVEGAEGKVLYVWFDAPIGYISNTRELLPPLHSLPVHVQGRRDLQPYRQRPGQRVPEPGGRQDFHIPQLGRLAERVHRAVPRTGGCAPLRALRQCPRNQGQRLHLEGLPAAQQLRAGGHFREFREPGRGPHREVFRREGACQSQAGSN